MHHPSRLMMSVLQYPHLVMLNIKSEWAFYVTWMKLIQTRGERPSVHYMQMDTYLGSHPFSLLVVINAQHNELHWGLLRMLNVFTIYSNGAFQGDLGSLSCSYFIINFSWCISQSVVFFVLIKEDPFRFDLKYLHLSKIDGCSL